MCASFYGNTQNALIPFHYLTKKIEWKEGQKRENSIRRQNLFENKSEKRCP